MGSAALDEFSFSATETEGAIGEQVACRRAARECSALATITGLGHWKPIKPEHPQVSGSALMRFQLVLSIGRDSAQIATQRRRIGRRRVHRWRDCIRYGRVRYHGCYRRCGLHVRLLETHSNPEASSRVDLIVLILILRLLRRPAEGTDGLNRHVVATVTSNFVVVSRRPCRTASRG